VFQQVIPFLMLLLVITLGFSLAIALLMRHTVYRYPDYPDWGTAMVTLLSAGLRFVPPELASVNGRWQVIVLYLIYLFAVSVILLNMLIAMMGQSLAEVRLQATNMAAFEHAKLVMLQEDNASFERKRPKKTQVGMSAVKTDGSTMSCRPLSLRRSRGSSNAGAMPDTPASRPRRSSRSSSCSSAGWSSVSSASGGPRGGVAGGAPGAPERKRTHRVSNIFSTKADQQPKERKRSHSMTSEAISMMASASALAARDADDSKSLFSISFGFRGRLTSELINPKWLHVLMPVVEKTTEASTHETVEKVQEQVSRLERDMQSRFDRLEEAMKLMTMLAERTPRDSQAPRLEQVAGGKARRPSTM